MIRAMLALALAFGTAGPAPANCWLALALGLDVSQSVDALEYRLQLDGLANALEDAEVQSAIFAYAPVTVRLMIYEWGDATRQRVLIPWTDIGATEDIAIITQNLRETTRISDEERTGLGAAVLFGGRALQEQYDCWQLTLDVSGDGWNNNGPNPEDVRTYPDLAGVTVNALVVGDDSTYAGVSDHRQVEIKELLSYFSTRVISGPLSFTEAAINFQDFEEAMKRKLLREMASIAVAKAGPFHTPLPNTQ
jgi:hypothetical protein